MSMSKYETIMWEKEMKEKILSHVRILYSRELTPNSVLDIVNNSLPLAPGKGRMEYKSHVVTIHAPTSTAWRVLLSSPVRKSVGESLQWLLDVLHADMRPLLEQLEPAADKEASPAT